MISFYRFFFAFFNEFSKNLGSVIKKARLNYTKAEISRLRSFFMPEKNTPSFQQIRLGFSVLVLLFFCYPSPLFSNESEKISLKTYPQLAIPAPNPMDLTELPTGKSFQITHPDFILQFFFNGKVIYGVILKRSKEISIYIHWCFFRTCEESPYDYKVKIADAFTPPYDQTFFTGKLPAQIKYQFQGLEFFTLK
ncbi:MAG: hypothetical protein NPINA01_32460 [Nitrospinaceae bacterium]|nr:MAG: hypothetical protein NPINA01_32460 [Nitrospinaceae bacterium]